MIAPGRVSPCPCGSGKRYKDCHGALAAPSLHGIMQSALVCQRNGDLPGAEALYRQALTIQPDEPDCLHMLGVICHTTGRDREAYDLVYRALTLTGWHIESMRHNMGLILVKLLAGVDTSAQRAVRRQYVEFCRKRDAARVDRRPLVSIVVPSYNHGRWIQDALASVYRQTYRDIELIVIDDGSSDGSPEIIRQSLPDCPFPHRLVVRENRGAHATINEGLALATGEFVNILNSDDLFPPDRIEIMVEHVACRDADWGFGGVSFIDETGETIDPATHRRAFDLLMRFAEVSRFETIGVALLDCNLSVSTGNLFVRRSLVEMLGGFRDYRYNHDWDFCLRATLEAEPVFVQQQVYAYRMHEKNTITESLHAPFGEANRMFTEYFAGGTVDSAPKNPFAPTAAAWGFRLLLWAAQNGQAFLIAPEAFRQLAERAGSTTVSADDPAAFEEAEPSGFSIPASRLLD
jgi:glycosyltransferase involved in cell wall biosynthesis